MPELILAEHRGDVSHVILDRPETRNALNAELVLALGEALRAASDDPDVHVVVLRGAGPMFSSGMDLATLGDAAAAPHHLRAFRSACPEVYNRAEDMAKPVVCEVHRACIGGAVELALACDLRVMAADALIGMPRPGSG